MQSARSQFFPRIILTLLLMFYIFTKLYNHHNQFYNIFNDLKRSPYSSHSTPPKSSNPRQLTSNLLSVSTLVCSGHFLKIESEYVVFWN